MARGAQGEAKAIREPAGVCDFIICGGCGLIKRAGATGAGDTILNFFFFAGLENVNNMVCWGVYGGGISGNH